MPVYVYIYIYIHTYIHAHVNVCMHARTHAHTHARTHALCPHLYVERIHVCVHILRSICMRARITVHVSLRNSTSIEYISCVSSSRSRLARTQLRHTLSGLGFGNSSGFPQFHRELHRQQTGPTRRFLAHRPRVPSIQRTSGCLPGHFVWLASCLQLVCLFSLFSGWGCSGIRMMKTHATENPPGPKP